MSSTSNSEYEYYMIPTWIAKIIEYNPDIINKKIRIQSEKYPFSRTPSNGNLNKILYASKYEKIYRDNLPIFGQAAYHQKNASINNISSTHKNFNCILDGTINASYTPDNIYMNISQGCGEFVEFIKEISSLSDPTNSTIVLSKTDTNKEFMKYIDTTYAISVRDFNINDAKELVYNSTIDSSLYGYNVPISIDGSNTNNLVIMTTNLSKAFPQQQTPIIILSNKECTPRWRAYYRTGKSNRKLILDVYNEMLYLNIKKKGDYDVQLDVYDENGNKYSKFLNGVISYK